MPLPDPIRSRAILIGVSRFEHPELDSLPAVANNLSDLADVLTSPDSGVFATDRCQVVHNPPEIGAVARPLMDAASRAEDVLFVYYAGHGVIGGQNRELYLTLPSSAPTDIEWTGLPTAWSVRRSPAPQPGSGS
jgi:Caspase domain